jgi:hypothetical protein
MAKVANAVFPQTKKAKYEKVLGIAFIDHSQ